MFGKIHLLIFLARLSGLAVRHDLCKLEILIKNLLGDLLRLGGYMTIAKTPRYGMDHTIIYPYCPLYG